MRRLAGYILAMLLLVSCGVDSDKFRLEGRLRNMNQGEFWVYSMDVSANGIDTIPIREGRFSYEIPLRSPTTLVIIFPNYSEQPVFAEPGSKVVIKGDASHLKEMVINGTDDNEEMTKLRMEINRLMPPEVPKRIESFIRENPKSEVSIYLLQRYFLQGDVTDYKKVQTLVELMLKEQPENGKLIKWKKEVAKLRNGAKNNNLIPFTAKDVKGRSVTQNDLKKKVNVVSVWASWNYQSSDTQRRLQKLKKKYGDKLGVVSICLDGSPADCKKRVERDSLPWKTVCDGRMWDTPLLATFGVSDIPANLVINSGGVIVERNLNPQKLEDQINNMLK